MKSSSRFRLYCGLGTIAVGVILNPWIVAWWFSPDGRIEAGSRLVVFIFDFFMIGAGLLWLRATRQTINGLIIAVITTVLAVVLLDLAARPLLRQALYYQPESMYKSRSPEMPTHWLFKANVDYQGTTFGDLAALSKHDSLRQVRPVSFVTDGYGYRNLPWDTARPLDLIILGDSFGAGSGCSQENLWDSVFRERYGMNTYNLSMPGNTPWHELLTLEKELPRLKVGPGTTVLWAIFGANDLDEPRPASVAMPAPAGFWMRNWVRLLTFYRRSPIKQLTEKAYNALNHAPVEDSALIATLPDGRGMLFFSPYWRHEQRTISDVLEHHNLPKLRAEVAAMSRFARSTGLHVLAVSVPSKCWMYSWVMDRERDWPDSQNTTAFATVLGEICRDNDLTFFDLGPRMLHEARRLYHDSGELLWWRDDTHWNPKGHAVAARLIGDFLTARRPNAIASSVH